MTGFLPNRFHSDHDGTCLGVPLGEVHHVGPHGDNGFSIWLQWGARIDLSATDLRRICREGLTVLAASPRHLEDIHDAVGMEGEPA